MLTFQKSEAQGEDICFESSWDALSEAILAGCTVLAMRMRATLKAEGRQCLVILFTQYKHSFYVSLSSHYGTLLQRCSNKTLLGLFRRKWRPLTPSPVCVSTCSPSRTIGEHLAGAVGCPLDSCRYADYFSAEWAAVVCLQDTTSSLLVHSECFTLLSSWEIPAAYVVALGMHAIVTIYNVTGSVKTPITLQRCVLYKTPYSSVCRRYPQRYVGASPFSEAELPQFQREQVPKCVCSASTES